MEVFATKAVAEAQRQSRANPRLSRLLDQLADLATATAALASGPMRVPQPLSDPDAFDREILNEVEPPPPPEALAFKVRSKSTRKRICSECGQPQFSTESGWVCENGHGGAPPVEG
jgi:hypothetical protein